MPGQVVPAVVGAVRSLRRDGHAQGAGYGMMGSGGG